MKKVIVVNDISSCFSIEKLRSNSEYTGRSSPLLFHEELLKFNYLGVASKQINLAVKDPLERGQNYSIKSYLIDNRNCHGRITEQVIYREYFYT